MSTPIEEKDLNKTEDTSLVNHLTFTLTVKERTLSSSEGTTDSTVSVSLSFPSSDWFGATIPPIRDPILATARLT